VARHGHLRGPGADHYPVVCDPGFRGAARLKSAANVSTEPPYPAAGADHARSAVSGLRWIGSSRIVAQALTWSMTLVTVRLLEPHDYGLVATAGLFTVFASLLLDGGLSLVLVSERELSARQYGAAFTWVMLVSIGLGAIVVAIAPAAAAFFRSPALLRLLQVSALQLPLWGLLVVPQALLAKQLRFRESALAQLLASVLQGAATLAMAYAGAAYWALLFGTMIGTAIRAGVQLLYLGGGPAPNLHFGSLRPLWRPCIQMLGQRVVYFFTSDFDILMLGRFAGAAALGPYSLAKMLAHTALDQISGVVTQVSVPVFAGKGGDLRAEIEGLLLVISTASVVMFPLFWLAGVLAPTALPLLFGARWASLVLPFMAFTFILPLRSVYALLDSAVVGTGRVATTFANMLTWTAIMVPLLLIAARFGANAAAATWVIGFPLVFWLAMRRIARVFGTRVSVLLRPLAAPLTWTAASCIMIELATLTLGNRLVPVARLAVEAPIAAGCYWGLLRSFARPQYEQALRLALRLVGR
jgi:teichuronic acid exporter